MERTLRRIALVGAFLVPLAAVPAHAQDPTPEGTVIENEATASYTDANGNTYADVTASVNVTVGFLASPDITGPATATPASPSTGNTASYTITNKGNGTDQFSVAFGAGSGLTITGYAIGATTYATLLELNTALAGTDLEYDEDVTVTVTYTVAPGQGGQDLTITATATSVRDNTKEDETETVVSPPVSAGGSVDPSGGSSGGTVSRLPSNGTTYTETFTLTNTGNASETYTLTPGSSNGTVATVSSLTGTGVVGGQVTLAPGESVTLTLTYTVLSVAAGSTSDLTVTAAAGSDPTVTSTGTVALTVIRAAISMTKVAYKENQTTVIDPAAAAAADRTVIPGETFYYLITVTNTGAALADDVVVTDVIPAELRAGFTAAAASDNVGDFGFAYDAATFTLTATLNGTLAASGDSGDSASFWIEVTVP
jgi:uncharacterized repeat protein (TIGR01451 family)